MHIDHIAIWTADLEKEKNFYLRFFNCTANEKYVNPKKQFSSYFISFAGGATIELMQGPDIKEAGNSNLSGLAHLAIDVGRRADVDEMTRRIEGEGYIVAGIPRVTGDGYYESVILDPEGNRIEILSKQ